MSTSYFAHAVYGVLPAGPIEDRLVELFEAAWLEAEEQSCDTPGEEQMNQIAAQVLETHPGLALELKEQYQAPQECRLFWTGDEDGRPGRCQTDPEVWVYGLGLLAMPIDEKISRRVRDEAEWHTWVTCG